MSTIQQLSFESHLLLNDALPVRDCDGGVEPRIPFIEAHFDGACEPNPYGHSSFGVVIGVNGQVVCRESRYIGSGRSMSCNTAEAAGALFALQQIAHMEGNAILRGDSLIVIRQLQMLSKKAKGTFAPTMQRAKVWADALQGRIRFEWIPREQNDECDELSKAALRQRGVEILEWRTFR